MWLHKRLEACTDGVGLRVTERDSGEVQAGTLPRIDRLVTAPGHWSAATVVLIAEGPDKQFDNIVVRRGCAD